MATDLAGMLTDSLWDGPGAAPRETWAATRTRNCLVRNGYQTVAELTAASAADLTDLRTFGAGCLAETRRVLAAHGLHLKGEEASRGR